MDESVEGRQTIMDYVVVYQLKSRFFPEILMPFGVSHVNKRHYKKASAIFLFFFFQLRVGFVFRFGASIILFSSFFGSHLNLPIYLFSFEISATPPPPALFLFHDETSYFIVTLVSLSHSFCLSPPLITSSYFPSPLSLPLYLYIQCVSEVYVTFYVRLYHELKMVAWLNWYQLKAKRIMFSSVNLISP